MDIIHEGMPMEVKYQEKINSEDFKPIREFMKKFDKKEGLMLTKNEEKETRFEEGAIKLVPVWKWLLKN